MKNRNWIYPLFMMGMLLIFTNGCKKNEVNIVDVDPFKVSAIAPLTDKIPYQALGAGKIVFERLNDSENGSGFYVIDIGNKKSYGFNLRSTLAGPQISSDGSKIACRLFNPWLSNPNWDVHIMNVDGSNCFRIFPDNNFQGFISWTPESKVIYNSGVNYIQTPIINSTDRLRFGEIYTTYGEVGFSGPYSISPNGKFVCVSHESPWKILLIKPSITGEPEAWNIISIPQLANNQLPGMVIFSPDGSKIAFIVLEIYPNEDEAVSVYTINPDGTNLTQVVKVKTVMPNTYHGNYTHAPFMCWSPDGTKILFTALTDKKSGNHLFVINTDGSGLIQVTDNFKASDYSISWGR